MRLSVPKSHASRRNRCATPFIGLLVVFCGGTTRAQESVLSERKAIISLQKPAPVAARNKVKGYLKQPDDWFASAGAAQIATNILSHQSLHGSWPKNIDTTTEFYTGERAALEGTFDNSATIDELRFIARIFNATRAARYKTAFLKGFDGILQAQYPNGGWPQSYPARADYRRHITFNDNSMTRLMEFVREVATLATYKFVDAKRCDAARASFERGIECILQCQVEVNGKLTAWCAQHDEKDFSPRPARTYELISLSGNETVGIVRLLMSLDKPDAQVKRAVQSAVEWLDIVKLRGIKIEKRQDKNTPKGYETFVVTDTTASPLWARFYEIGTNQPLFVDRDGIIKYSLAQIGYERRNGYAWLGDWPAELLKKEYPEWQQKWPDAKSTTLLLSTQ